MRSPRTPLVEDGVSSSRATRSDDLEFGADGALYASGGDGASFNTADYGQLGTPPNPCGDPPEEGGALRAQDLRTGGDPVGLDGTLIRIDPDTGAGLPDNPLSASSDPNARRIVGYGFRNPFRFAIDPEGGDVYLANVGWNDFEEIDHLPGVPGQPYNSGWPCFEGLGPTPNYSSLELPICESLDEGPGGASPPFFLYRHGSPVAPDDGCRTDLGSALSGITFYEGGDYPAAYDGALFFADSVRGCIFVMFPGRDGRPDPTTTTVIQHRSRHLSRRRPDDRPRRGPLLREALRLNRGRDDPPNQLRPRCPGRPPDRRSPLGRRRAAGSPPRRQRIDRSTGRRHSPSPGTSMKTASSRPAAARTGN